MSAQKNTKLTRERVLKQIPTSKEMARFLEHATEEQRREFIQEVARLMIDLHRPALKELERY
ncbi:MAG: hypothetical protein HY681_06730 [Chloroflexi bacterium]|nr:hypothetical protein [Chloroflexota bacterium]